MVVPGDKKEKKKIENTRKHGQNNVHFDVTQKGQLFRLEAANCLLELARKQ